MEAHCQIKSPRFGIAFIRVRFAEGFDLQIFDTLFAEVVFRGSQQSTPQTAAMVLGQHSGHIDFSRFRVMLLEGEKTDHLIMVEGQEARAKIDGLKLAAYYSGLDKLRSQCEANPEILEQIERYNRYGQPPFNKKSYEGIDVRSC